MKKEMMLTYIALVLLAVTILVKSVAIYTFIPALIVAIFAYKKDKSFLTKLAISIAIVVFAFEVKEILVQMNFIKK